MSCLWLKFLKLSLLGPVEKCSFAIMQSISVTHTKLYILYSIYMYVCVCIYIYTQRETESCTSVGSDGKESACNAETQVWSLDQEDPLEKGMTTHSSILACRIPWTEETGRLQSMRLQRVRQNWATNTHTHTHVTIYFSPCRNISNFILIPLPI